jgi:trans-aconitate 2-methyltransferase
VTDTYQWNAADYAAHSAAQYEWAQELIARLRLREGEAVLDIGCGDGKVTALIGAQVPRGRAVGIDSSPEMIALAADRFPLSRYPNLRFRRMDARALAFEEEFDVTFSNATLHWVADHPAVLRGVQRGLKPSGRLLFQMGGQGNAVAVVALLERMMAEERWRAHFEGFTFPYSFYGPEEYRAWLAEAGLEAIRAELVPKDMRHRGGEGLAGWIRTTWLPYLERVPEPFRDRFLAELVETYVAEHPTDATGFVHVSMMRLEVEAVKSHGKP